MWKLGVDMGVASLGWCALGLNQTGEVIKVLDGNVRLFPDGRDGQSGTPLNVQRREARSAKRLRDRSQMRQKSVLAALVSVRLLEGFDTPIAHINPHEARSMCAEAPVCKLTLARALLYLSKTRGFKSNRRDEAQGKSEESKILGPKFRKLEAQLDGKTLGQFLWHRRRDALVKAREVQDGIAKAKTIQAAPLKFKEGSDIFPTRAMMEQEFDAIQAQQGETQGLNKEDWTLLRSRIFFQRPLKPQERGKCTLYPHRSRALRALVSSQDYALEQKLCNLRLIYPDRTSQPLTPHQCDGIRTDLWAKKSLTWNGLRKLRVKGQRLFPDEVKFNLEEGQDPDRSLQGNQTRVELSKVPEASILLKRPVEDLDHIVELLIDPPEPTQKDEPDISLDEQALRARLGELDLSEAQIDALLTLRFASGTMSLCTHAMQQLTPLMRAGMLYNDAVQELQDDDGKALHHSHFETRLLDRLPYYGQILRGSVIGGDPAQDATKNPEQHYGKISNVTVHVALNQLRKLVNALVARFGPPASIHIELARDLPLGAIGRSELKKALNNNAKRNQRLREFAQNDLNIANPNGRDILKLKLWEELSVKDASARCCPYSGRHIPASKVLTGEIEIEHILPFSRTLDDTNANKTLAYRSANALKANQSPYEAFGKDQHADKGYVWANILSRAANLRDAKKRRFDPDAMKKYDEDKDGFIQRSLNDTRFLSRAAKQYLSAIIPANKITTVTGRHTSNLRHDWGLNSLLSDTKDEKNRDDHRHHLIDAFVIALTTRSLVKHIADAARYDGHGRLKRGVGELPTHLRTQLRELLDRVVVSYKPDRDASGKFYAETAYGKPPPLQDMDKDRLYRTRMKVEAIGTDHVEGICDPQIRAHLNSFVQHSRETGEDRRATLEQFLKTQLPKLCTDRGIKRLRVRIKESSFRQIASASYKGYAVAGYAFVDIWKIPPRKPGNPSQYLGNFIDIPTGKAILAKQKPTPRLPESKDHPGAKRCMRLFKDDMVQISEDGQVQYLKVFGFSASNNRIDIRPANKGGKKQIYKSINQLCFKHNLRHVLVSVDGRMKGRNR